MCWRDGILSSGFRSLGSGQPRPEFSFADLDNRWDTLDTTVPREPIDSEQLETMIEGVLKGRV
jgi:hypothetical protein